MIAEVGALLERSTSTDGIKDRIRLVGELHDGAFSAEPVAGFGTPFEITANELLADYGVTEIKRGPTEVEAQQAAIESEVQRLRRVLAAGPHT